MKVLRFAVCLSLFLLCTLRSPCADTTYVRFSTSFGYIDVQLLSDEAPNTVANFLSYVNSSTNNYNNSIIHRDTTVNTDGLAVVQGGTWNLLNNGINLITQGSAIASEAGNANHFSNTRGTLAMALSANQTTGITDPNSATDGWFFNVSDNSGPPASLDAQGFTVFGVIANTSSLSVMDRINALNIINASTQLGSSFGELPVLSSYNSSIGVTAQDLVYVISIAPLTLQNFAGWQTAKFSVAQQNTPNFTGASNIPWHDGVPNMLKYVCDIDPSAPMTATARANLPSVGSATSGGQHFVTLTYHQNSSLSGVTINLQTSPDLQTWTTVTNPIFVETGIDSNNDLIIQAQASYTGARQFVRLNVTQP